MLYKTQTYKLNNAWVMKCAPDMTLGCKAVLKNFIMTFWKF